MVSIWWNANFSRKNGVYWSLGKDTHIKSYTKLSPQRFGKRLVLDLLLVLSSNSISRSRVLEERENKIPELKHDSTFWLNGIGRSWKSKLELRHSSRNSNISARSSRRSSYPCYSISAVNNFLVPYVDHNEYSQYEEDRLNISIDRSRFLDSQIDPTEHSDSNKRSRLKNSESSVEFLENDDGTISSIEASDFLMSETIK